MIAKRRIAILGARGYPSTYGGFETLVRRLAPFLREKGDVVDVYCRHELDGPLWGYHSLGGVGRRFTPGIERQSMSTLTYGLTGSIDASFREYDTVIVFNVANGIYLPLLAASKKHTIINVDGLEWRRGKWNALGRAIFRTGARATAQWANDVVLDSEALRPYWKQGIRGRIHFIPYGADLVYDRPTHRVRRLGLDPGQYFLVVARLVPENNVELIVEAYEAAGLDIPLVVVGSGVEAHDLMKYSKPGVCWMGHVSDQELLLDLWSHCTLYLHGHSVGGTNPALLQAMGAGSPILALATPFNWEVLRRDDQLFSLDVEALAHRLRCVVADTSWRLDVAKLARVRIGEAYRWDAVCEAYRGLC